MKTSVTFKPKTMDFYRKHKHTKGILTTKHDNHHDTQKALKLIQFKKRQATIIGCAPQCSFLTNPKIGLILQQIKINLWITFVVLFQE